jgi:hypothetical protein
MEREDFVDGRPQARDPAANGLGFDLERGDDVVVG